MGTLRSTHRATNGLLTRHSAALRTAVAGGLAVGLMALVAPNGSADPRSDLEQRTLSTTSEQVALRAADAGQTPRHDPLDASASPASTPSLEADLTATREEQTAALATLSALAVELDQAKSVQSAALEKAGAAQDALMGARVRLGDLITSEDAAVTVLDRAVARVERAHPGSKARRSAFTQWQMAAVSERAAHARRTIAADIGSSLFAKLRTAETALAEAELALGKAQSARLKAERSATAATTRVDELEAAATSAGEPQATPTTTSPGPAGRVQP